MIFFSFLLPADETKPGYLSPRKGCLYISSSLYYDGYSCAYQEMWQEVLSVLLQCGREESNEKDSESTGQQESHSNWNEHDGSCSSSGQAMHGHDRKDCQYDAIDTYGYSNESTCNRNQANQA